MRLIPTLTAFAVALVTFAQPVLAEFTHSDGELTHINGVPVPPIQTAAQARAETEKKIAAIKAREAEETATRSQIGNRPSAIEHIFYTGKPDIEETGQYAFLFRSYDPELSRWTTADPSGFPDGANNVAYVTVPTSEFDWQGLISVTFRVVSSILPPDSQDGTKSSHHIVVNTDTQSITSDISFVGTSNFLGSIWPGSGTLTATLNSADDCHINLTMTGIVRSALLPVSIDYSFNIFINLGMGKNGSESLFGAHDGYPSFEYFVNGTKYYDFPEGYRTALLPPMNIPVSMPFNTGIENPLCE